MLWEESEEEVLTGESDTCSRIGLWSEEKSFILKTSVINWRSLTKAISNTSGQWLLEKEIGVADANMV